MVYSSKPLLPLHFKVTQMQTGHPVSMMDEIPGDTTYSLDPTSYHGRP